MNGTQYWLLGVVSTPPWSAHVRVIITPAPVSSLPRVGWPPAASRQSLHPGPRSPAIIRCRAQLLAPANPRQHWRHFPHSINYQYFISSIPTGALVVRKCIGTLVSCNLVEKMTAGSGLSTPHFSNISLDRFRIIWSPKPETSSPTLSSL